MSFTTLIGVDALRRLLPPVAGSPGVTPPVLLDCRFDLTMPGAGRDAYWRAHIPGARYADLNEDLAGPVSVSSGRHPLPEPPALARRFAAFGIAPGVQVVAYDEANGSFAARAWWLLRWLGHLEVAVLDGGFKAWLAAGGESESGSGSGSGSGEPPRKAAADPARNALQVAPRVARQDSPPDGTVGIRRRTPQVDADAVGIQECALQVNSGAVVAADDVLRALDDASCLLVDARAAERYAGKVEPIDPVAGHVAGAVNHPFADNLREDGRFLAPAELRRRWQERLGGKAPENTILMCGSGVTACHNLLALEVAGLPGAKLYAGSWSEWVRDPERPIRRGSEP